MAEEIRWRRSANTADVKWLCPFADGVSCRHRRCGSCGWAPGADQKRLKQFKETGRVLVAPPEADDYDGHYVPGLLDENV